MVIKRKSNRSRTAFLLTSFIVAALLMQQILSVGYGSPNIKNEITNFYRNISDKTYNTLCTYKGKWTINNKFATHRMGEIFNMPEIIFNKQLTIQDDLSVQIEDETFYCSKIEQWNSNDFMEHLSLPLGQVGHINQAICFDMKTENNKKWFYLFLVSFVDKTEHLMAFFGEPWGSVSLFYIGE